MSHINLKNLPESERPYERFRALGAESLSDAELLAIILKTGTKDMTSLELARSLLSSCQGNLLNLYELTYEDLLEQKGIGPVKAIQLKAVAELSRRIARTNRGYQLQMNNPKTIADYFMEDSAITELKCSRVLFSMQNAILSVRRLLRREVFPLPMCHRRNCSGKRFLRMRS